ncbi:MAG: hypothetical protein P8179_17510 [Candidatus Thiodiazotropha sp.]|jgi:hypothetical protein
MGLEEKKMRNTLEKEIIPEVSTDLKAALGTDVEIKINWDSFEAIDSLREIQHQVLGRIVEGVKSLCEDDFAKGEAAEQFKTIEVNNLSSLDDKKVEFANNTLTIQTTWADFGNIFTPGDIKSAIEAGL